MQDTVIINGKSEKISEMKLNRYVMIKFNNIAKSKLNINTLLTQHSDDLDFHNISVWQMREALLEAYKLGLTVGTRETEITSEVENDE